MALSGSSVKVECNSVHNNYVSVLHKWTKPDEFKRSLTTATRGLRHGITTSAQQGPHHYDRPEDTTTRCSVFCSSSTPPCIAHTLATAPSTSCSHTCSSDERSTACRRVSGPLTSELLSKMDCFKFLWSQVAEDGGCERAEVHRMNDWYTTCMESTEMFAE